jgi:hypothetical protein
MLPEDERHLKSVIRHIQHVRDAALLLGERLIENGEDELGLRLIGNSHVHDYSKFRSIEWLYLRDEVKETAPDKFDAALKHHRETNPHHPEYWQDGIKAMPAVYVAEMVCDWKARANEFGTDMKEWINEHICKRHTLSHNTKQYKVIKRFVDTLLDEGFKK